MKKIPKEDKSKTESRILELIKKNTIETTAEISQQLGLSWNTAEKYLLEIALENKIQRIKKAKTNLWMINKN